MKKFPEVRHHFLELGPDPITIAALTVPAPEFPEMPRSRLMPLLLLVFVSSAFAAVPIPKPPAIDARYLWQASDGEIIIVRNTTSTGGLVPIFEARADSPYAYLNTGKFLSSNPGMANGGVKITMYDSTN